LSSPIDCSPMSEGATTTVVLEKDRPRSDGPQGGWLVQIFGDGLGTRIELRPGITRFGRGDDNDVVLVFDAVSRSHCEIAVGPNLVLITDLGSTNGTLVRETRLAPNQSVAVQGGDVEAMYHDEIYRSSVVDSLTGLYNRCYLFDHLAREIPRSNRHGRALALILFDLDHFKEVNDQHGHLAGDHVLREIGELVQSNIRREDCCARYGGEEFAIASSESDLANTRMVAEKLRGLVEAHHFEFEGTVIPVTISVGVAMLTPDMAEPSDLVGSADSMLYEAKRAGRNRVEH